jgi:peptide chain release factor 1
MLDKLEAINHRFEEVGQLLTQPDVASDMKKFKALNKEYKDLDKIVVEYKKYLNILSNIDSAKQVIATEKDEDFREMAKEELDELLPQREKMEELLKELLIPKDPNDSKDIIMEIRAGAGGDEASIFAGDLYRMYSRFAERMGWRTELIDATEGTSGGYKEIIVGMSGEDVYGKLKFESGVHRVQRVPATETQGRIHTSVASVVVLPERPVHVVGPWRTVGKHHVLCRSPDAHPNRYCGAVPGPEIAAEELRQGVGRFALAYI